MTTASRQLIEAALAAYDKLDTDEQETFRFVIQRNEQPAAKRGRPPAQRKEAAKPANPAPETA